MWEAGDGGGGCHSKACLPKLALPWMKQFIVELCSCLSPHLHGVEKIIRVSERGCRGLLSNPTLSWRGDPRGRGLPATLMHNIVTGSVSAFIEASCFLRFAPFYRRSVIKINPGLWGHFFPLVQSPVINTFSVRGAIICKSRARCRRGVPFRSVPLRDARRAQYGGAVAPELLPKQLLLCEHKSRGGSILQN